jgi:TRAP-type C4-dicarboxylate transport system substrate-binding protein
MRELLHTKQIKRFVGTATATAVLGAAIAMSGTAGAATIKARLSYHWGPKHPAAKFANAFAERVTKRSGGRLKVEVFPSGQLFGIRQILGAVSSGSVEFGMAVGIVSFTRIDRDYLVSYLPGYFTGFDNMRDFFAKDPVGHKLWKHILDKAKIDVVGYDPVGPVAVFSTRKDLSKVDSFKGAKARVLVKAADTPRWQALGIGKMVSLPTRDVYTALQNNTIDTVSTVPGAIRAYSWWEKLRSVQLPYSSYADAYIITNRAWFNKLPADLQKIVREVLDQFKKRGGKVFTLSGAELAKMRKLERDVIEPKMTRLVSKKVLEAARKHAEQGK